MQQIWENKENEKGCVLPENVILEYISIYGWRPGNEALVSWYVKTENGGYLQKESWETGDLLTDVRHSRVDELEVGS